MTNASAIATSKINKNQICTQNFFHDYRNDLVSIGLEIFLVPNHIIDGGIVGISIILSHLIRLSN